MLLVPQAMAYAALAGLSPQTGLYASIAPALCYALLGTSRFVSIGPIALVSLLVADVLGGVGAGTDADPQTAALMLAAIVGVALLALGLLRLGPIANFIGEPVISGFTAAAALLIAAGQLRHLLGIELDRGGHFFSSVAALGARLNELNVVTALLGVSALTLLIAAGALLPPLLRRAGQGKMTQLLFSKSVPLLVLAAATLLTWRLALDRQAGVAVVGEVQAGLPPLTLPPFEPSLWLTLLPGGLTVALVIFIAATAVGASLAGRRRQKLLPDQEAIALGAANLAAACSGGYPVGASLSRSALNADVGARTPAAGAVTALLLLAAALLLGPLFYYLPKALLAALVISAIIGMIKPAELLSIWRHDRAEGVVLLITVAAVLGAGVQWGLAAGAAAGVLLYLWRTGEPRITVEGRLDDDPDSLRSVDRDSVDDADAHRGPVLVLRIDQDLYFANAPHCERRALAEIADHEQARYLLLDMQSVNAIDYSGCEMLKRLHRSLDQLGVGLGVAALKRPLRTTLERAGVCELLGDARLFETAADALSALDRAADADDEKTTTAAGARDERSD